jgi:ABC-2 type transport system permease protein
MSTSRPASPGPLAAPAGSIYDLGYRHYDGKRFGRLYASWSLYVESLRSIWGFGRSMSGKAAPFILAGLYALPALVELAFSSQIAQRASTTGSAPELLTYADYFTSFSFLILFFCVAQAPELVCRDQRYQVLPLYFTRAMGRMDYALARLASLATALFIVLLVPTVALFVGDILMKPDTFGAIGDEVPKVLPALPANALIAVGMSAISLALSSFSPRRAYSAIGIVAYTLLAEAIPAVIYSIGKTADWSWADKLTLLTPLTSLMGATNWFFGKALDPEVYPPTLASGAFVLAALASCGIFAGILLFRYRRIGS